MSVTIQNASLSVILILVKIKTKIHKQELFGLSAYNAVSHKQLFTPRMFIHK